uniref:ZP domain-containing protein n=1 Tax=Latimeria chalumnae TaxID=7897 RepID=H3AV83_LATCH
RATSCCYINNVNGGGSWQFLTSVDLGIRSDTGKPNLSPKTTFPIAIRVPQNCQRTYQLLAYDVDKDAVRCRYGTSANNECGFTLDQNVCTLTYNAYSQNTGNYLFELEIEDYPTQTVTLHYNDGTSSIKWTSDYLSQIPLHFIIEVGPSAPSCSLGLYIPQFVSPTPAYGAHLNATVGITFQLSIGATASANGISDFIISGPINITKTVQYYGNNQATANIEWTPTQRDEGDYVPVCFVAVTPSGYQSELRCVLIRVGPDISNRQLRVDTVPNKPYHLHAHVWDMGGSRVQLRGGHEGAQVTGMRGIAGGLVKLVGERVSYSNCGCHPLNAGDLTAPLHPVFAALTHQGLGYLPHHEVSPSVNYPLAEPDLHLPVQQETSDYIVFENEITSFDHPYDVITRKHEVQIPFSCSFPKRTNVSSLFRAHKGAYIFSEAGFGQFSYVFEFYTNHYYTSIIDPASYPVEVELQDMLYMEIQVQSSLYSIEVFVESCRATAHDDPNDSLYYDIIKDGCLVDDTVVTYPGNQTEFRFGMEAFTFIGSFPEVISMRCCVGLSEVGLQKRTCSEVYMSCTVILCKSGDPNTRCAQGCINGTSSGHHHHKRSLASETQRHYISQGPL